MLDLTSLLVGILKRSLLLSLRLLVKMCIKLKYRLIRGSAVCFVQYYLWGMCCLYLADDSPPRIEALV